MELKLSDQEGQECKQLANAGVIAPPLLIFAIIMATGLIANYLYPLHILSLPFRLRFFISLPFLCISGILVLASIYGFRVSKTPVAPHKPTTAIVDSGVFCITRNPMYLSLVLLYTGVTIIANSLFSLVLLPVFCIVLNNGVICREERYLEQKFGKDYLEYKSRVRRWI